MALGVVVRHSRKCRGARGDYGCCAPGFEAWIYDAKRQRKVRATFTTMAEARAWRLSHLRRRYDQDVSAKGKPDKAYAFLRKAAQELDGCIAEIPVAARPKATSALASLYRAEDELLTVLTSLFVK